MDIEPLGDSTQAAHRRRKADQDESANCRDHARREQRNAGRVGQWDREGQHHDANGGHQDPNGKQQQVHKAFPWHTFQEPMT
jgi:hypothetical protein